MLILVVDDEESLCELVADILADDYEVIKAYNGKEALDLVNRHHPDLIISDVMMPHMSGLELLKILRSDPATGHIPLILLSAVSMQAPVYGAAAFVSKPFEIDVLEKVVREVIKTNNFGVAPSQLPSNDMRGSPPATVSMPEVAERDTPRQYYISPPLPYHNVLQ